MDTSVSVEMQRTTFIWKKNGVAAMPKPKRPNQARRYTAYISLLGTTQIHLRSPYIIAWWSAAFPGFGHLQMSKYIRGMVLVLWEILINVQAGINEAMVYSFTGRFDMAKDALEPRWMLLYIPVYLFAIWDSYRTTVDLNKLYLLADLAY